MRDRGGLGRRSTATRSPSSLLAGGPLTGLRAGCCVLFALVALAVAGSAGAAVYEYREGAATARLVIPARAFHPAVRRVEECRRKVHARRLWYATIEINNTRGTSRFALPDLWIVTRAGRSIELKVIWLYIGDWPIAVGNPLYNKCRVHLYNSFLGRDLVLPGARSTALVATHRPIANIRYIFATPFLGEPIQLRRVR